MGDPAGGEPFNLLETDETAGDRARHVRRMALEHGFDRCAIAAVTEIEASQRLRDWVAAGMHGSMQWMERNLERRADPTEVVAAARSVVVVAMNYHSDIPVAEAPHHGRISRYAWGGEYHQVLGERLAALQREIETAYAGVSGRWYVDTGPVLEKAWAERAGLGWIGKHTNLIDRDMGSWIFLGALILDLELGGGAPHADYCGTCTACIDVCPTAAIVAPYVLDARRCIAYLTIENRGPIPREFRRAIGNHVFGCDDCQDVCPWNRFARQSAHAQAFAPRNGNHAPPLLELLGLDERQFRERFRGSPIRRAKYRGFLRNVLVAIGNSGAADAVPAVAERLDDADPMLRAHAAWALGNLGGAAARRALQRRREIENDDEVAEEIDYALDLLGRPAA